MSRGAAWIALPLSIALALAGCASTPRNEPPQPTPGTSPKAPGPPAAKPGVAEPARPRSEAARPSTAVVVPAAEWPRIRAGFRFAQCERAPVRAAVAKLLRSRGRLAAMLSRAMPALLLVRDALERAGVPLEYVFLPMIESEYTPVVSTGNRPAGMWQIMPITARGLGLVIDADYDERLDAVAASRAAASHLAQLAARFDGDWRLVTMAYNAGEFRVRGALRAARRGPAARSTAPLSLPAVTHAHLARLEAWACIAADPERHGVVLPELRARDRLVAVRAESAIDVAIAARLARERPEEFRRHNAAHRRGVIATGRLVLVRAGARARYERLSARIPPPDRAAAPAPVASHTVRSGESLWRIARRHGVSVAALCAWNELARDALLRPGDVLRLAPKRAAAAR